MLVGELDSLECICKKYIEWMHVATYRMGIIIILCIHTHVISNSYNIEFYMQHVSTCMCCVALIRLISHMAKFIAFSDHREVNNT